MSVSVETEKLNLDDIKTTFLKFEHTLKQLRLHPAINEKYEPEADIVKLEDYEYTPLKIKNSVRLLRLRPASDESDDIDAELAEFALPEQTKNGNKAAAKKKTKNTIDDTEVEEKPSYEAVSWCWGKGKQDQILRLHKDDKVYAFYISENLKAALWALRKNDEVRQLWIDAICINQKDLKERNEQVPRMDRIYGSAKGVCIWLGVADDNSRLAMEFIKNQVLSIWEFDKLIANGEMATQWAAFITLMKRPWFSRRWVVQEIALSCSGGTLYCGKDAVSWSDFADAVSLFVEVESATHRLSDVMKRNKLFGHMSDYFGDVSSLGAALLVDATSNLFRTSQNGERKPLSTLEYLVSKLSVFEASQPRDTIYALLAISKDTTPRTIEKDNLGSGRLLARKNLMLWAQEQAFTSKPYIVDYNLPVIEVYKQFIEFSIRESDKTRALDIICRPWAPTVLKRHDKPEFLRDPSGATHYGKAKKDETNDKDNKGENDGNSEQNEQNDDDVEVPLPSWIPSLSGAAYEMEEHPTAGFRMERQNADPLVGLPESGSGQTRNYTAAGTKSLDIKKLRFLKWTAHQKPGTHYPDYGMLVQGFVLDKVATVEQIAANGNMPFLWLKPGGWTDTSQKPPEEFWRTLVADRGPKGRNPPTYFPRACQESMKFKAKTKSKRGILNSEKFINEGQCTIVAEFLRRVQAVIWNRLLMTTKKNRLGLIRDDVKPGYLVCILYGCSVPVILQKIRKKEEDIKIEHEILFEEWLEKRKRVCYFFMDMRRMVLHRRSQPPPDPEKDILETSLPKSRKERLELLQRPRKKSTFPLMSHESQERDMSPFVKGTTPGSGTSSVYVMASDNETPYDNETSAMNEISPIDTTASTYTSAFVDSTTQYENGSLDPPEKIGHDNDEDKPSLDTKILELGAPEIDTPKLNTATLELSAADIEAVLGPEPPDSEVETSGEETSDNEISDGENSDDENSDAETVKKEAPEASQKKAKQKEKEDPNEAAQKREKWKEIKKNKAILQALGKREAERRERKEWKYARPSKWYYKLVGECYVNGMMNGEAIAIQNRNIPRKKMLEQVFELR